MGWKQGCVAAVPGHNFAPGTEEVVYREGVRRLPLLLLPLALVACQRVAVVPPEELPPLRESALGERLELSGRAGNWTLGQTAQLQVAQTNVGTVRADGTFTVSAQLTPSFLTAVEVVLLPLPFSGEERTCSLRTLTRSDPAARASRVDGFNLTRGSATTVRPQLSPVPPMPMLLREQASGQVVQRVLLVYVDRDVRISGQKSCTGKYWPWDASSGTWTRDSSINVFLRRGWNTVTMTEKFLGGDKSQLTVQGGDTAPLTPWRYNGVPLSSTGD